MTIHVSLNHVTAYHYDRRVSLGPQVIRLRPAPHTRTPVSSYTLRVEPEEHFLNWQQDPFGNFLARLVFPEQTETFRVEVNLTAEMTVINPFDFFTEDSAERFPFEYEAKTKEELKPYLKTDPAGPKFRQYLESINRKPRKTIDFLVELNQQLQKDISYLIRMEPGVQTPEETLTKRSGSCRDSAWLLVQLLREMGLATRFVSGYLIQLVADQESLDGPSGPAEDFTDLHAWTEVYLPGAGWVGMDPTSGLLTGEGHIPLAATPHPTSAAPITGGVDESEVEFEFNMSVTRVHEDPRVTKPYTESQWERILQLGEQVDQRLDAGEVRLTMGGEPTFVSIDDMEGAEWNTEAVGLHKLQLSTELIQRLQKKFAPGGLLHYGQGKWYPGESLPRWAFSCFWRSDGEPLWSNPALMADQTMPGTFTVDQVMQFARTLAERLEVGARWVRPAYEDVWESLKVEQEMPVDENPLEADLDDPEERQRLARILEQGMGNPVGAVLPLKRAWWQADARWISGHWPFRSEYLFLIPGDSPIGLRLPLERLPETYQDPVRFSVVDPFQPRRPLPAHTEMRQSITPHTPTPSGKPHQKFQKPGEKQNSPGQEQISPEELTEAELAEVVPTALCVECRQGRLHVFMPPVTSLDDYVDLLAAIEDTAEAMRMPLIIEGYLPPVDPRLQVLKVTPDPGVIEVNVHPATNWRELVEITEELYAEARMTRLGTEKFQQDGRHTGTGGGNHFVLGAATPMDSPFLRRPDLLKSLICHWNNHPSLSYIFSGMFIGPTSQAPRVDEGRQGALYELAIAFQEAEKQQPAPPWLVDRLFRHLLVDLTGNTHRAEFCIDKLYSPDSSTGRLGLVELRAFEMPPHPRMSLVQQLLIRALIARFWETPGREELVRWKTLLHDRFLLPYYLEQDFRQVVEELNAAGFPFEWEWFAPHLDFRCPPMGSVNVRGVSIELRQAIEPWYVLGEEPAGGATARYVDSSVERLQVHVQGLLDPERYLLTCNSREVPLTPTETLGECVAGVRYRAWQPPNCLHPTIPVDTPLVFDLVDLTQNLSLGGCCYHIEHPGGLNPRVFPVNSLEAESRRATRFDKFGHTGGTVQVRREKGNPEFPHTLDMRRNR